MDRLRKFAERYFWDDELPFEARILNFTCFYSSIAVVIALISRFVAALPFVSYAPLIALLLAIVSILILSLRNADQAELLMTVIVFGVSAVFWPILYFTVGGPGSGFAVYFALAIILDFTLLKGNARFFALIVTNAVMIFCYVSTLFFGFGVLPEGGLNTYQLFIDILQSILIVGFLMGAIIWFQTRLYKNERSKVESAQSTVSSMFESNPHINVLFDMNFNVIDCNPAAVKYMGFESKESLIEGFIERLAGSIPATLSTGRQKRAISEYFHDVVNKGHVRLETELILEGARRFVDIELTKIPYKDSYAIVGYILDMTEIHTREMELRKTRELNELQLTKLNLAAKATKIGLWDMEVIEGDPINPKNPFIWSDEFRSMLGFTDENDFPNLLNSWSDRLHPEDKSRTLNSFAKHLLDKTGQTPYDIEYKLKKKDGEYAYFRASGETIRDAKGTPLRVAGALMDITETKNLLLQMQEQRTLAEAANRAKSDFLSTMSHEIRTPMNAILGITEIALSNDPICANMEESLSKIYASGDMLLGIINDILDFSKIEAGKLELVNEKYEIASVISDTSQLNMMRIGSKQIEFELEVDENLPAHLLGDELRVKQILNNILSNAFKYTDAGTVRMSISSQKSDADGAVTLIFRISDTGQGMTEEQVAKLFDEYSRFNMDANRTTEGTGLGMSITRNLLRLMHGDISVESEPGKGSTFTVRLPQGIVNGDVLGKGMAENLHNFRTSSRTQMKRVQITRELMPYGSVLIVDDVETNLYVAKGLLSPYQVMIETADSAFAAIEKIKNGKVYDIIFMDHMMPKMDGIEATKIIRDMGYSKPIVALTANAVAGQADIFLSNGFDDFISKPIDVRQLNTVLNKHIRDKQKPETIAAARQSLEISDTDKSKHTINPRFAYAFARDAAKSIAALEEISGRESYSDYEDMRTYIIHVHGMKSALANIRGMDLSAVALKLEMLARDNNIEALKAETPAFIQALRSVVEEITRTGDENNAGAQAGAADTPPTYLSDKLLLIKNACAQYDARTAKGVVAELRSMAWSQSTKDLLNAIAENLLHSDFDEVAASIDKYMESQR